jgi:anti-anti-sigma factor
MEIAERKESGVVVLVCRGRMDGHGSAILEQAAREALHDDDRSLVLDMEDVPYLSSAGIRVMLALQKRLRERGGKVALAGTGDFPRKVLDMAGFLSIFPNYSSVEEAVRVLGRAEERSSLLIDLQSPFVEKNGTRMSAEPGSPQPAALKVWGDLDLVLHSRIDDQHIAVIPFSGTQYALGLGALGRNPAEVLPFLGEMVVLHGSLVWLPTDGNDTPDFFTPVKDTGEVKIFSGYSVSLDGPFREYVILESLSRDGMPLQEIYSLLIERAKEHYRDYRGVLAVAWWAVLEGLQSQGVCRSPIPENAPPEGKSIMDPSMFDSWFEHGTTPRYRGDTMVGFGIAVDLDMAARSFDQTSLDLLISPKEGEEKGKSSIYSHTHAVVFRNVAYDMSASFEVQVKKILGQGEFVDMRHLLLDTRIRKAKIGVAPVSALKHV